MPSEDIRKFTPVSYRTSAFWSCYPAPTPLLQQITPSRAWGTADHTRSLVESFVLASLSSALVFIIGAHAFRTVCLASLTDALIFITVVPVTLNGAQFSPTGAATTR